MTRLNDFIKIQSAVKYLLLFYVVFFVLPKDAHAYLDPGSGSYIIQIAIAAILGSTYVFKGQVLRISQILKNLFSNFFSKKEKSSEK